MEVVIHPKDIYSQTKALQLSGKEIGLVPTMGALHEGHFSLITEAIRANDITVVSIFINPLQFNKEEDLLNYPKTIDADIESLEKLGVDLVYIPGAEEMYKTKPQIGINFGSLSNSMEGSFRPGHFSGVGIVVTKLFNQTNPDRAYFGLKDLQQYLLIKRMTEEFSYPIEVIGLPTAREQSGLAMSSRNKRLSQNGLKVAENLFRGLMLASEEWHQGLSGEIIKSNVLEFYQSIKGFEVEYFSVVDPESLSDIKVNNLQSVAFCVAGYVEGVRLIDNLYLRQDLPKK